MIRSLFILISLAISTASFAQEAHSGEVIKEYGKIYEVSNPDFKTDTTAQFKVVFDVAKNFDNPSQPNKLIETAARFINMHRAAGIPAKNIQVALVIHGGAYPEILKDEFYNEKFPEISVNPNAELISLLANQGVQVILCGQTAAHRKITKSEVLPEVQIALSAMTALVQLQNKGYRLINF
ncbi:intracellular sulfur oxidation DsrE/DsrF family protein [Gillisia sp. Hel_I_86]|uniref:DsrE family protein n=1 Tax=Gillisia sp. Hel_I_86 TaxID=1249981 RepID=UPI00119917C8|nr:DsrE family protein [Gillisia sp. Hel_I_86]TVZ27991.1 intracellular sulfur oxidation DsrE/DsrF family protein [Gillisia sp. Hel_I_86]